MDQIENARLQTFGIFSYIYVSHYKYKLIFKLKCRVVVRISSIEGEIHNPSSVSKTDGCSGQYEQLAQ